jgi:hypothetical protein
LLSSLVKSLDANPSLGKREEDAMSTPLIVIAAVMALAMLYVLTPVAADAFFRYRARRVLRCPETGKEAEVSVDARRAAFTSALGKTLLRVKDCSLWPERKGCRQDCLKATQN